MCVAGAPGGWVGPVVSGEGVMVVTALDVVGFPAGGDGVVAEVAGGGVGVVTT